MKINELFTINKGRSYFKDFVVDNTSSINYVTTSGENNGVKCRVAENPQYEIFEPGTITVAMQGSVLSSFVQPNPFYLQTHVAALIPKVELNLQQKIFYCLAIHEHANKFSFGRKANRTLEDLEIPSLSEIPDWVETMEIPSFADIAEPKIFEKVTLPDLSEWKSFSYPQLFEIKKVSGPKVSEVKKTVGSIPYVSATSENNGIVHYGDFETTVKGNCITIGHLGDCFYQTKDFAGSNVTVLIPKFELNKERAMFLLPLLNAAKFKYCYGRVIGITRLKEETISLPVTIDDQPDWELIERYIKSMPYSKYL